MVRDLWNSRYQKPCFCPDSSKKASGGQLGVESAEKMNWPTHVTPCGPVGKGDGTALVSDMQSSLSNSNSLGDRKAFSYTMLSKADIRIPRSLLIIEQYPGPSSRFDHTSLSLRLESQKASDRPSSKLSLAEGGFEPRTIWSMRKNLTTKPSWHRKNVRITKSIKESNNSDANYVDFC